MHQIFIQKLTAPPDERFAGQVFVFARTLADKQNLCVRIPRAEHDVRPRFAKRTGAALQAVLFQFCKAFVHKTLRKNTKPLKSGLSRGIG